MFRVDDTLLYAMLLLLTSGVLMLPLTARAASCKTQSQMTVAERDALSNAAKGNCWEVQSGDVQALRQKYDSCGGCRFRRNRKFGWTH
jgi:hypothetical protein